MSESEALESAADDLWQTATTEDALNVVAWLRDRARARAISYYETQDFDKH